MRTSLVPVPPDLMKVNIYYYYLNAVPSDSWDFQSGEGLRFSRLPVDLMKCRIFRLVHESTSEQHLYSVFDRNY